MLHIFLTPRFLTNQCAPVTHHLCSTYFFLLFTRKNHPIKTRCSATFQSYVNRLSLSVSKVGKKLMNFAKFSKYFDHYCSLTPNDSCFLGDFSTMMIPRVLIKKVIAYHVILKCRALIVRFSCVKNRKKRRINSGS